MVVTGLLLLFGGRGRRGPGAHRAPTQASVDGRFERHADAGAVVARASRPAVSRRTTASRLVLRRVVSRGRPVAGLRRRRPGPGRGAGRAGRAAARRPRPVRPAAPGPAGRAARRPGPVRRHRPDRSYRRPTTTGAAADATLADRTRARRANCAARRTCSTTASTEIEAADTATGRGRRARPRSPPGWPTPTACGWPPERPTTPCSATPTTRPPTPPTSVALLGAARGRSASRPAPTPQLDALAARVGRAGRRWPPTSAPTSAAYPAGLDADPARLEQIEARRAVLAALVRKYGDDLGRRSTSSWLGRRGPRRLAELDVSRRGAGRAAPRARRSAAAVRPSWPPS